MPFPFDPNAPGGPPRSEFVRASFATTEPDEQEPVALAEVGGEPLGRLVDVVDPVDLLWVRLDGRHVEVDDDGLLTAPDHHARK
jgi:hypothetical protein